MVKTIDCPICNVKNIDKKHPYSCHKIKYASFIEKYYPRFDILTKEPIKFKSEDSYFLTDFNDKRNLKKYLESISKEGGLNYLKDYLCRRREFKQNSGFALTEFEIKSLIFPSINYIERYYGVGSYKKLCLDSRLQIKYDYNTIPEFDRDISGQDFICDTREQKIISLPNMQVSKLEFGDYTLEKSNLFIERKSLADLLGTLSKGYERFNREIQRCKNKDSYLLILIEENYKNLQSFEYMPHIHSKCTWSFISHRIRELIQKYPCHIQFLAVDGRQEAARIIEKVFKLEDSILSIDLQYLYDIGDL